MFAAAMMPSSADARKISAMRPRCMAPLYHEEKRGPGDFPGPRHYSSEALEGVADPRRDRRDILRIGVRTVQVADSCGYTASSHGQRCRCKVRRGERRLVGVTDPHVARDQIECQTRGEPPRDTRIYFSAQFAASAIADRSADVARGDARAATPDTVGIDFLCGPALHGVHADGEGRRERVARADTDTAEAVLVVADGERRRRAARRVVAHELVEVIDADVADFTPARPPLGVRADRLEGPELRPRIADVLAGLVTRRVGAAALEEQRTRAPATSDVHEPGVHVLLLQRARRAR